VTEPLTEAGRVLLREHSSGTPHMARHVAAIEDEVRKRTNQNLREALTGWYAVDGESWRLVAMDRDGGILAAGIPEELLDAIIRRATREETT